MSSAKTQEGYAPGTTAYDFSLTPFYQSTVDIDGGGDFGLSSALLRLKMTRAVTSVASVGLSLKYDMDDYDFSGFDLSGEAEPWNDVRRFGIGIPFFTLLRNNWSVGATPAVDWLRESGADNGDSISYGVSVFTSKIQARDKRLGVGAGVFRNVADETSAFPFIVVDWRLGERWRVANPFEADALGPAGLELSYRFNDRWHLGGGGSYRSFRFRLNNKGAVPNGVGRNKGIVGFLRLRRVAASGVNWSFYTGAIANGKLELEDSGGNHVSSADYDTAPFVAITVSGEF